MNELAFVLGMLAAALTDPVNWVLIAGTIVVMAVGRPWRWIVVVVLFVGLTQYHLSRSIPFWRQLGFNDAQVEGHTIGVIFSKLVFVGLAGLVGWLISRRRRPVSPGP